MSDSRPWLATKVASLVPSMLHATVAQACVPSSDRHGSPAIRSARTDPGRAEPAPLPPAADCDLREHPHHPSAVVLRRHGRGPGSCGVVLSHRATTSRRYR